MTASQTVPHTTSSTSARVGVLAAAVAVAVGVNLIIAAIATAAGAPAGYGPLSAPALVLFTALPMTIGWFAWRLIARRARNPRRTLTTLVAIVFLVSLIPDVILLVTGFVPGTTTAAVIGLLSTHVVVLGTAVLAYTAAMRR